MNQHIAKERGQVHLSLRDTVIEPVQRLPTRKMDLSLDARASGTGFTLLEIILALAILAGSLAALGEVMRLADQNASMTRDESQAQILASSVMDELVAGRARAGGDRPRPVRLCHRATLGVLGVDRVDRVPRARGSAGARRAGHRSAPAAGSVRARALAAEPRLHSTDCQH